jgi:catechol 2,3-dioxygenase-like lactoylglutathione lyase family enzyme
MATVPATLGRFLEVGVHAPDIVASLAFYESLGFTQATAGETWSHPYAVVTDGRLFVGLHAAQIPTPTLTYVLANLNRHLDALRALGIEFEFEQLGSEEFNRVVFRDPSGLAVQLLEARTFSPPLLEQHADTSCGYFSELGLPTKDFASSRGFWEPLGFVAWEEEQVPFRRMSVTSDRFNLGLYQTRALKSSTFTFVDSQMRERIAELSARGFTLSDEMPDALAVGENAVLIAPEGTRLLLLSET